LLLLQDSHLLLKYALKMLRLATQVAHTHANGAVGGLDCTVRSNQPELQPTIRPLCPDHAWWPEREWPRGLVASTASPGSGPRDHRP
jgi:hypothetical protein